MSIHLPGLIVTGENENKKALTKGQGFSGFSKSNRCKPIGNGALRAISLPPGAAGVFFCFFLAQGSLKLQGFAQGHHAVICEVH